MDLDKIGFVFLATLTVIGIILAITWKWIILIPVVMVVLFGLLLFGQNPDGA